MLHSVQLGVRSLSAADILCHWTRKPQSGDPQHMDPHDIRKCQTASRLGEIFNWDDGKSTHSMWPLPTLQSRLAFPDEFILDHGERWASGVVVALRCGVCGCQPPRLEPAGGSRTQPSPSIHPSPDQRSDYPSTLCLTPTHWYQSHIHSIL